MRKAQKLWPKCLPENLKLNAIADFLKKLAALASAPLSRRL